MCTEEHYLPTRHAQDAEMEHQVRLTPHCSTFDLQHANEVIR